MHEAGIAARIAEALRSSGLDREGPKVRLRVRGGHDDPQAFDEALRLHLFSALPSLAPERVSIEHEPVGAVCVVCQRTFEGPPPEPACPSCGSPGLVQRSPESVTIEVGEEAPGLSAGAPGGLRPQRTVTRTSTERPT